MDANEFINLLNNPEKVEGKSVEELKKLATEYPFSQPVQLLYAIRLSQSSEYLFNRQLGKTSILTDDRTLLFDLFEREPDEEVEGSLELSLDEKLQKEFKIEERNAEREEPRFPRDPVEQKLVQRPMPPAPEVKPEVAKKPEPKPQAAKRDLSHLSPSEKVKAILEENRRLREEFAGKKSGVSSLEEPVLKVEELESIAEQSQEGITEESLVEENLESVGEAEEVDIPFTIEEEKSEPIFEIGGEDLAEEVEDFSESEEDEVEIAFENKIQPLAAKDEGDSFVKSAHSFGGWLKYFSDTGKKYEPNQEEVDKPAKEKSSLAEKINLLDSFVEKLPALKQKARFQTKEEPKKENINMNRLMDDNDDGSMVTETLARVYIKQKHYDKAIKAYEIMKLKYPEKSSFFADQISEIKKLSNSK